MIDVNSYLSDPDALRAAQSLARLFREGLRDTMALPEIHTEADEATHALLGCDHYLAMMLLAGMLEDLPEDTPAGVREILDDLFDRQMNRLGVMVVAARGPLGPHACGGTEEEN
jgi:hypothetical protein